MIYVDELRDHICGYSLDIKYNKNDDHGISLVFQKRKNAEMVKKIIEADNNNVVANIEELDTQKESKKWRTHYSADDYEHHYCPSCGEDAIFEYIYEPVWDEDFDGEMVECGETCTGIRERLTPFCPQCGVRLEKGKGKEE